MLMLGECLVLNPSSSQPCDLNLDLSHYSWQFHWLDVPTVTISLIFNTVNGFRHSRHPKLVTTLVIIAGGEIIFNGHYSSEEKQFPCDAIWYSLQAQLLRGIHSVWWWLFVPKVIVWPRILVLWVRMYVFFWPCTSAFGLKYMSVCVVSEKKYQVFLDG